MINKIIPLIPQKYHILQEQYLSILLSNSKNKEVQFNLKSSVNVCKSRRARTSLPQSQQLLVPLYQWFLIFFAFESTFIAYVISCSTLLNFLGHYFIFFYIITKSSGRIPFFQVVTLYQYSCLIDSISVLSLALRHCLITSTGLISIGYIYGKYHFRISYSKYIAFYCLLI